MSTGETVFFGATLIDGTGSPPQRGSSIRVRDGRIVDVGRASDLAPDDPTHRVDASGKYIVPGLMDANVHLLFDFRPELLLRYDPGCYDDLILEAAQVALRAGITTVFDTYGPLQSLRRVRDRIAEGTEIGSRIFCAGNIIGSDGPWSVDMLPWLRLTDTIDAGLVERINREWEQGVGGDLAWMPADDVRALVREYAANSGVDFIKYSSSVHGSKRYLNFSADAQRAIVEEAHAAGMTAQACVMTPEAAKAAVDAGANLLQHVNSSGRYPLPGKLVDLLVNRQLPCAAVLFTERHLAAADRGSQLGADPWGERLLVKDTNARALIKAGARLLLSTDGGVLSPSVATSPIYSGWATGPDVPVLLGTSHVYWFAAAVERGMPAIAALQAATRDIADAYGRADDLGTVEQGKRADLLVLDANPLEDAENYARITHVVKDGVVVDRDRLPERPILSGREHA